MAINIKEILSTDTDSQKVEKLNYNFDQILANGGGPIGAQGAQGPQGAVGSTGAQGPTGAQGAAGPAGLSTDYFYKHLDPQVDTLFPSFDQNSTGVTSMVLGDNTIQAPNVTYASPDVTLYLKGDTTIGKKPLRIGMNGGGYLDIDYTESAVINIDFTPSPIGGLDTHYKFTGQRLALNNGADKVVLSSTNSIFNSNIELNSNVKITSGNPGTDKVLTSDAVGNVSWTQPTYYEPAYGTIVMIGGIALNSTNLELSDPNAIGRGKGEWSGWYYCWGKTWGKITFTITTPDLRDRFALGYSFLDATHSTASKTGDLSNGTNNVDDLASVQTADAHTHTINTTDGTAGDNGGPSFNYINTVNPSTANSGAKNVDLSPKTATVGYMIYLGADSYTYA